MADQKNIEQAKSTYATLCRALEKDDWRYRKDEEKLTITCGARGDDLPMEFVINVDEKRLVVLLMSPLSFAIPDDKRLDVAIAVSALNYALVDGSFDYDLASGKLFFRMTNSFRGSTLGEGVFTYMLYCAAHTIDKYNDKFLMLSKGLLSVEQFLDTIGK